MDDDGRLHGLAQLDDDEIKALRSLVAPFEQVQRRRKRLGATLDVKAVLPESGEVIWFYRATKAELATVNDVLHVEAEGSGDHWRIVARPRNGSPEADTATGGRRPRGTEIETISAPARPASEVQATYYKLIREVITDFVNRFSAGRGK